MRIQKAEKRSGDNAQMAVLSWVDSKKVETKTVEKKSTPKTKEVAKKSTEKTKKTTKK
jgi:hypothetical protein